MIPVQFDYDAPETLNEALALLAGDPESKVLAGGQSLIPLLKLRLGAPSRLIDLARIPDLSFIARTNGTVRIGAMTTHHQVESSELLREQCPLLAETAAHIGDVQVRNRGTIGGSVVHADPAADYPAALLALEARVKTVKRPPLPQSWESAGEMVGTALGQLVSGAKKLRDEIAEHDEARWEDLKRWRLLPNKERETPIEDFLVDALTTAIEPGEILTEVHVPPEEPGAGVSFQTLIQPASGFAIAAVAARIRVVDGKVSLARIGISGVASSPYRATATEAALEGVEPTAENIAAAAAKAAEGVDALEDVHAGADYRAHIAAVLARRAIEEAVSRTQ